MQKPKPIDMIYVSNPDSGFGIYLFPTARDHLGGYGTKVTVTWEPKSDGKVDIWVRPDKNGKLRIGKNGRTGRNSRIFWTETAKREIGVPVDYEFGGKNLPWAYDGPGIHFVFPAKGELKNPMTKTAGKQPRKTFFNIGKGE